MNFKTFCTYILIFKSEFVGRVTDELRSFLLLNLPEAKADFSLGVESPKLGSRIFRVTNMACICDKFVLELLRGVQLHIITFTEFPEVASFSFIFLFFKCVMSFASLVTWFTYFLKLIQPCNLDEATTETLVREREDLPLLKYEFDGCVVEDMKKGRTRTHVATLMDMVILYTLYK